MSKPAALPLSVNEWGQVVDATGKELVVTGFSLSCGGGGHSAPRDLRDHIVRCVNNFDLMLRALEAFVSYDESDYDSVQMMIDYAEAVRLARNALSAARSEP